MTRKDFQLIADAIRTMPLSAGVGSVQRPLIAAHFADTLAETNPRFRRDLFIAAATKA